MFGDFGVRVSLGRLIVVLIPECGRSDSIYTKYELTTLLVNEIINQFNRLIKFPCVTPENRIRVTILADGWHSLELTNDAHAAK